MDPIIIKIVLIIVILIIILKVIKTNNQIIALENRVEQSRSGIDVFLTQRFDLIPKLVECVKGYMKYEKELLEIIIKERNDYVANKDLNKAKQIENKFNNIMIATEKYPELKANEQFLELQKNIVKMENQLQSARRLYNGDATLYNTVISTYPTSIIANLFNHKKKELFEIEEIKKENANIEGTED